MLSCILMFDCWTDLRLFASLEWDPILGSGRTDFEHVKACKKKSKSFLQIFFCKTCLLLPGGEKCRSMLVSLFSFCEVVLGEVTFL